MAYEGFRCRPYVITAASLFGSSLAEPGVLLSRFDAFLVCQHMVTESFESRIVGVAHGFGVLVLTESAVLINGILANLEAAKDGVRRDQWLTRQQRRARVQKLDDLWVALAELCDRWGKLRTLERELDLKEDDKWLCEIEAEMKGVIGD